MIKYILDGLPCEPINREDIKFSIDYTDEKRLNMFNLNIDSVAFVMEDKLRIEQHLVNRGAGHGMRFDVQFTPAILMRYYLDFTDGLRWTENEISCKIKRFKASDNFFDNANALSWRVVNIPDNELTKIDFVLIQDGQNFLFITLLVSFFTITRELIYATLQVAEAAADLQYALTPIGPGIPNVGAIIKASLMLAARTAYALAIAAAMIQLVIQIVEIAFPPIRELKDIPYWKLIEKGCQHLGYTFDSNALKVQLAPLSFLGAPIRSIDAKWITEFLLPNSLALTDGFPAEMDAIPTLGQAIDTICELFNLRTRVANGVVKIERKDFFNVSQNAIPLAFNLQDSIEMERGLNSKYWKRYLTVFAKDARDSFTYDYTIGHIAELDTSVTVLDDQNLNLIKGLVQIRNPFAKGFRKKELTRVEKFIKNVIAPAVDLFSGGALTDLIENRLNVLAVSDIYFTTNKLLWKQGSRISPEQETKLSAINILNTWHNSERPQDAWKERLENVPVRMNIDLFLQFVNTNFVTLENGQIAEIKRIEWSERDAEASVDIEIPSIFVNNINTTTINDGLG